jgi:hypothetical protein
MQHLARGGVLDLPLLHALISDAWSQERDRGRYEALADAEDAAYQVRDSWAWWVCVW